MTTLALIDATLPMLDAAIADQAALGTLLDARVAPGWEGFPEALPHLRANLAREPGSSWATELFVLTEPRTLVGMGGFKGPPREGAVEIGYAIAPAYRGRGLATEAARLLTARALVDIRVRHVEAHTLGHASASTRVLEKVGMQRVAEREGEHGLIWQWRLVRPT